jgi:hypothetical protein
LIAFLDALLSDFTPEEKETFRKLTKKAAFNLFEPEFKYLSNRHDDLM